MVDLLRRRLRDLALRRGRGSCTYSSYEEALRAAGGNAYLETDVPSVVARKTERLKNREIDPRRVGHELGTANITLAVAMAGMTGNCKRPVKVLDVGGACGAHYFCAKAALVRSDLEWCVVETPPMVAAASPFSSGDLSFSTSVPQAVVRLGLPDLLLCSSTLQYSPDPVSLLDQCVASEARLLLLCRLPLTDGPTYTIVQRSRLIANGPGPCPAGIRDRAIKYPVTFLSRQIFESVLGRRYSVIARYPDSGGNYWTPLERVLGGTYVYERKP